MCVGVSRFVFSVRKMREFFFEDSFYYFFCKWILFVCRENEKEEVLEVGREWRRFN